MSDLLRLISSIRANKSCKTRICSGQPVARDGHLIPDDLAEFFKQCGGLSLWLSSEYSVEILPSEDIKPANPIIIGEACLDDISSDWYTIARTSTGDYITIDFSPDRNGRCYDSFYTRHGIIGDCPFIAESFHDLLFRLYKNKGEYWYWLKQEFTSLGDAYDS